MALKQVKPLKIGQNGTVEVKIRVKIGENIKDLSKFINIFQNWSYCV